jgi:signal transduction histidine kinase/CheY-like chemotaxis protein/ligand-binding sensor domain-containing protein
MNLKSLLKHKRIFLFSLFFLLGQWLSCESSSFPVVRNIGLKYFTYYNPKIENLQPQNWDVLQDKRGIIYSANQGGMLEFDGVSWRLINVPNWSVRSITIDQNGTIYIGGNDEMGLLIPDENGSLQYVSLLDHLKENQKKFSVVWKTHTTIEGIYFHTLNFLFRWNPGQKRMKIWQAKANIRFNASFSCRGKLFIRQENLGLMQMLENSLILIPGGETFANKKIYMMAEYQEGSGKLLIGTRYNGFYLYDGITSIPFSTEADDYVKKHRLYQGIQLSTGDFALATLRGGLVIIDSQGRLKQIFNKNSGLPEDNVKHVYEDFQGNLWLALNKGLAKIEYTSPFSLFDHRLNLPGLVLAVSKHQRNLYVGTDRGLYSYSLTFPSIFHPVPGMFSNCWSLLSTGNSLLAATTSGVFQVVKDTNNKSQTPKIHRVIGYPSYVLLRSPGDPNRTWVGGRGLVSLYLKSKPDGKNQDPRWIKEHDFSSITQSIRTIGEDKNGSLWLGTLTQGVLKVEFPVPIKGTMIPPGVDGQVTVTRFDASQGLPPGEVNIFTAAGHVVFATEKGIFRFREKDKTFIPDFTLGKEFANSSRGVFRIVEDSNKHIWFHSRCRNFQAVPTPGEPGDHGKSYVINEKPFLRIPLAQVNTIYPEERGGITWFGGTDGLVRYDSTLKKNYKSDFAVFIREVLVNGKPVFNGYKKIKNSQPGPGFPVITYKNRNLRFSFAAPFFEDEPATQYRCFLEGYDKQWPEWIREETKKEYTNLDPGMYVFRVQARNVYDHLGEDAVFHFKVLPPWYKTWWAFIIYALIFFLLVFFIVKWRSRKLVQEKQYLETIVNKRTAELNRKNQQLEEQSAKLKELDKAKSRFFANISHEFRTPLTLIMGPLEHMITRSRSKEQKEHLNVMLRNSQRLLTLINQLLDLSRLDSGKMKLQAAPQDIVPFLKGILDSFRIVVDLNKLEQEFIAEKQHITLYFDAEKLEEVIGNLLTNAVKFTPSGGKISVKVTVSGAGRVKEKQYLSGFLEISVSDTGIGIPNDRLAHIFDRFYQAEGLDMRGLKHKGSGIGLALTRELVELHHGRIDVHSRESKGTEFIILLPLGNRHLKPHEMVSASQAAALSQEPDDAYNISATYLAEKKKIESMADGIDIEEKDEMGETGVGARGKNVILVVEDHTEVRDYIRGSFEPGYRVVEAVNGREGINKARDIIPDLIISDIMMPVVDGYDLCRQLKNHIDTCHIPIVLLTAKAAEEDVVHGLEVGADDYITKPFNTKILCARIKNLIDLRYHLQMKIQRQKMLMPDEISVSSMDEGFLKEFQDVIEKNLSEPDLNIDHLCDRLYMSRATLFRKVQALTGQTPIQFIQSYRLQRAAQLLKTNFGNVTEVAFEVGFSSPAYFTKRFKEKFHQLPSTFQASESS